MVFITAPKLTNNLGYFCNKMCYHEIPKIAPSGHNGPYVGYRSVPVAAKKVLKYWSQLFIKKPLLANCVVYGGLYSGAEFTQQLLTKKALVS